MDLLPSNSDIDYRKWANHLVGRDWEIFWKDEEDGNAYDEQEEATKCHSEESSSVVNNVPNLVQLAPETTASGQETAEQDKKESANAALYDGTTGIETNLKLDTEGKASCRDVKMSTGDINEGDNQNDDDDRDGEGSIIDDWYDGHVISIIDDTTDSATPIGEQGWKFRVSFVGDNEIYELFLVPSKIRPSARGWVQRTLALLVPPVTAAGENQNHEGNESNLPPDTGALEDQKFLELLRARIIDTPESLSNDNLITDGTVDVESLPTFADFCRIQNLQYQLESQIYLRSKLSKIENHAGKELFTDGIRNPTEPYVNHLVQCCKDLVQSCSWYCKSWKLLLHYFGTSKPSSGRGELKCDTNADINNKDGDSDSMTEVERLTFRRLITDYLEFGKNTIVNTAMIDTNSPGNSSKRRQHVLPPTNDPSSRRTKRRRKQTPSESTEFEGISSGMDKILTASSRVDSDILSSTAVNDFLAAITDYIHYRHMIKFGNMLRSLMELVVIPLVSWKGLARRILNWSSEDGENELTGLVLDRKHIKPTNTANETSSDDEEAVDELFTYGQIQECLMSMRSSRVLSCFNLFDDVHGLHTKMNHIQRSHSKALGFFASLASLSENVSDCQDQLYDNRKDRILAGLTALLKEMESSESTLYNVRDLSSKTSSLGISRDHLSQAITLRTWFVDVQHVQSVRERNMFVQRLIAKLEPVMTLPDTSFLSDVADSASLSQKRDDTVKIVMKLKASLDSSLHTKAQQESDFLLSLGSFDGSCSEQRSTHLAFLQAALARCKSLPAVFPFEEKIAARLDILVWYEEVHCEVLSPLNSVEKKENVSYTLLKGHFERLQALSRGISVSRASLIQNLEPNTAADDEVMRFVSSNLQENFAESSKEISNTYTSVTSWKERAENVITSLRGFGNPNAGDPIESQKNPAMVDIKRIVDLNEEHPKFPIKIPGCIEPLKRIQLDAFQWSQNVHNTLFNDDSISLLDILSSLESSREKRPKGVMIHPNRSVLDAVIDILKWYRKIKSVAETIADTLAPLSVKDEIETIAKTFSSLIRSHLYPILAEGADVMESYCSVESSVEVTIKVNSNQCLDLLHEHFGTRRTPRLPSFEKIDVNRLGSMLFSRMASQDEREGSPLRFLRWVYWHLMVADFSLQIKSAADERTPNKIGSLVQAEQLQSKNPFRTFDLSMINDQYIRVLVETRSTELFEFDRYIQEAQTIEMEIKEGFAKAKELLRGSLIEKENRIKEHLACMRSLQSKFKDRALGNGGLSLNQCFENPLEQQVKYFIWVAKSLQYPVLHEGEASYALSSMEDQPSGNRISWDALVGLHDRIPIEISESGNSILCILRVRELYSAAKKWQDEVCRCTMISKRGNKRRGAKASYQEGVTESDPKDLEKDSKIHIEKIESLAEDRILSKVDMPRQKAVQTMLDTSRLFETQLENFLAQDFDGYQDNAPLPGGDSLVGRDGQFILYRLTGSALFYMMQTSVQSLAEIGANVFAETRGKATFDWMSSAVEWIEELQDAVVKEPKFIGGNEKILIIPFKDAKKLCESGENVFLETNRDVTQTLSNHGIYVSVNSIKKQLRVKLKKDGAHHSVGGIIIRWCPILFDALRADVLKLMSWERDVTKVVDDFHSFESSLSEVDVTDEEKLFQWYTYGMKLESALEEGQNSLVVFPMKDVIETCISALFAIKNHLEKNCSRERIEHFSKRLFANNSAVHDKRFELLDSLLYRRKVSTTCNIGSLSGSIRHPLDPEITFRDRCRSSLENVFLRAAATIGWDPDTNPHVKDLSAMKAWEIESEMFETFQVDAERTDEMSNDYREKARSLKSNLDNRENQSLSLKVLMGDLKPNILVKMTPDQLASEKAKLQRERATLAAMKDKVLTPGVGITKKHDSPTKMNVDSVPQKASASHLPSILKHKPAIAVVAINVSKDGHEADDADGAPTMDSDDEEPSSHYSSNGSSTALRTRIRPRSSPPPPPPPSLVSSFDTCGNKGSLNAPSSGTVRDQSGVLISNAFGGQSFRIEIQGHRKYAFDVRFYRDHVSNPSISRYLGEYLVQKGRSRIDDFQHFVSEKLKGGRWQVTCLRMATSNVTDTDHYREYCNDFEAKERIAMFKLYGDSGGKLFLVTPKFHGIARNIREIAFEHKENTYAVVLTKRDDGEIWNDS